MIQMIKRLFKQLGKKAVDEEKRERERDCWEKKWRGRRKVVGHVDF